MIAYPSQIFKGYCPTREEAAAAAAEAREETAGGDFEEMHLLKDTLKNPILDYVQHCVFADPDAKPLVVGGREFCTSEEVNTAFLDEKSIKEDDLKEALAVRISGMLEGVRKRFTENKEAKGRGYLRGVPACATGTIVVRWGESGV